jgi:hypothetical protein
MKKYYFGFAFLTLVVIAAVIYGFSATGTPKQKRAQQFDQTRMSNLNSISYQIQYYYEDNDKLPTSLSDIKLSTYNSKDPETGEPYSYKKVSDTTYELCATFGTDSADVKNEDPYDYYGYDSTAKTHKKGYDCIPFELPKYIIDNAKSMNNFVTPQAIVISSPSSSSEFKQGSNNAITWTGQNLANIDIKLYDSNGTKLIGYVTTIERNKNQNVMTYNWTAQTVYSKFTGTETVAVPAGKYKLQVCNILSEQFSIIR